jgi:hypothetical protein
MYVDMNNNYIFMINFSFILKINMRNSSKKARFFLTKVYIIWYKL